MKCPRCQKETTLEGNPYRPFCSERCKLIDLGRWAAGDYRVPTTEQPPDETHQSSGPNGQSEDND